MRINEEAELRIDLSLTDDFIAVGDCLAVVFKQPYIESLETFWNVSPADDFYQPFPESLDWTYSATS